MKHWYTTLFGIVGAVAMMAHNSGITLGHIGNTDFLTLLAAAATGMVGVMAADAKNAPLK